MYSRFQLARKYLHYLFTASNGKGHGMHSPFVFEFIKDVLNDNTSYPAYHQVEHLRRALQKERTVLPVLDLGAGSASGQRMERSVSSIIRNAAKPPKYGQLLYRIAQYYKPRTIIELGTSLGVSTSYLSLGNPAADIVTLEGAPAIAAKARENFSKLGLTNINVIEGNFDSTLPATVWKVDKIDLVFIDGNHRSEPTLRYFEQILPCTHNDAMLIFDDIHWSPGMEDAWKAIQQHKAVRCTIDLFFIGIVLFRQEFKQQQQFVVRF